VKFTAEETVLIKDVYEAIADNRNIKMSAKEAGVIGKILNNTTGEFEELELKSIKSVLNSILTSISPKDLKDSGEGIKLFKQILFKIGNV